MANGTVIESASEHRHPGRKRSWNAAGKGWDETYKVNTADLESFVTSKLPFGRLHPEDSQVQLQNIEAEEQPGGDFWHVSLTYATPNSKGGSDTTAPDPQAFELRVDGNAVDVPLSQHPEFDYRVTQAMIDDPTTSPAGELPDNAVIGDYVFKGNKLKAGISSYLSPQPSVTLIRRRNAADVTLNQGTATNNVGKLQRPVVGSQYMSGTKQEEWLKTGRHMLQNGLGETATFTIEDSWQHAENGWDEDIYDKATGPLL